MRGPGMHSSDRNSTSRNDKAVTRRAARESRHSADCGPAIQGGAAFLEPKGLPVPQVLDRRGV